jgi:hypothetical protein
MESSAWQSAMTFDLYSITRARIASSREGSNVMELIIGVDSIRERADLITSGSGLSIQIGRSVTSWTASINHLR